MIIGLLLAYGLVIGLIIAGNEKEKPMTRTETWRVESWDEGNHAPAQFNRSAGWVPAGHLLHSEAEARAWAEHLKPVAAPLRILHRTIEEEVIDL